MFGSLIQSSCGLPCSATCQATKSIASRNPQVAIRKSQVEEATVIHSLFRVPRFASSLAALTGVAHPNWGFADFFYFAIHAGSELQLLFF